MSCVLWDRGWGQSRGCGSASGRLSARRRRQSDLTCRVRAAGGTGKTSNTKEMLQSVSSRCLAPFPELAGISTAVSVLLDERLGHCGVPRREQPSPALGAHRPHHVPGAFWQGVVGHIATSAANHKCSIFCQLQR